jgi:transposase
VPAFLPSTQWSRSSYPPCSPSRSPGSGTKSTRTVWALSLIACCSGVGGVCLGRGSASVRLLDPHPPVAARSHCGCARDRGGAGHHLRPCCGGGQLLAGVWRAIRPDAPPLSAAVARSATARTGRRTPHAGAPLPLPHGRLPAADLRRATRPGHRPAVGAADLPPRRLGPIPRRRAGRPSRCRPGAPPDAARRQGYPAARRAPPSVAPGTGPARAVGIDEWAWRRRRRYGTILCDLERRRVVDLLPDRNPAAAKAWLRAHPEIGFVARGRSGGFAGAASQAAPGAVQVADRWHSMENASAASLADRAQRSRPKRAAAPPPPRRTR